MLQSWNNFVEEVMQSEINNFVYIVYDDITQRLLCD